MLGAQPNYITVLLKLFEVFLEGRIILITPRQMRKRMILTEAGLVGTLICI
jgi:hypothetical protein